MSIIRKFKPIIINPSVKHSCSIIFLHGSGDTGEGVKEWVNFVLEKNFCFEHARVIYPTAPPRPYTPMNGALSTVWFDRKQISPFVPEELDTVDAMCIEMKELIEEEVKTGIPINRIVVGGFSMGGALALHLGYRFCTSLAGVFALSSFLNDDSVLYEKVKVLENKKNLPPLFQGHGISDPLVDFSWGKRTSENLTTLGVHTSFYEYKDMFHEMKKAEIIKLQQWILEIMPVN